MSKLIDDAAAQLARELPGVDTKEDVAELVDRLRGIDSLESVLSRVVETGTTDARGWVASIAPLVLGTRAAGILRRLARDRDGDVRIDAIRALESVDPSAVRALLPRIRKGLRSPHYYEPTETMWVLAAVNDVESIREIENLASGWDPSYWMSRVAEIVLTYLRGDFAELIRRIREHDHASMPWLARAVSMAGGLQAEAALEECVRSFGDEDECGSICRAFLAETRSARTRRQRGDA